MPKTVSLVIEVTKKQAEEFLKKGYIESAIRDNATARIQTMPKLAVSQLQQESTSQAVVSAISEASAQMFAHSSTAQTILSKIDGLGKPLKTLSNLSYLNIAIGLVNLGVEVVGLVCMQKKLNALQNDISHVASTVTSIKNILTNEKIKEYRSLTMRFGTVIDKLKTGESVSLDALDTLLIDMNTYISDMLLNLTQRNIDLDILLQIIFGLLPVYTALLKIHIREYYFEKHTFPGNMDGYTGLYAELLDDVHARETADYLILNKRIHIADMYTAIRTQNQIVEDCVSQIKDQLELVTAVETRENYAIFNEAVNQSVIDRINEAVPAVASKLGIDEKQCSEIANAAFRSYLSAGAAS